MYQKYLIPVLSNAIGLFTTSSFVSTAETTLSFKPMDRATCPVMFRT